MNLNFTDFFLSRTVPPEFLLRSLIRRELADRLKREKRRLRNNPNTKAEFIETMKRSPIFLSEKEANEQHYEVPTAFFQKIMGERMKYSCCFWNPDETDLSRAEEESLKLTCERAKIQDGERILELGCGWGSLTLFMAERFPNATVTAVSNSRTQKRRIDAEARRKGLDNVKVVTANFGEWETDATFDRAVSVEMFEHARNYRLLLDKIANLLRPRGKLFVHVFLHDHLVYPFEADGNSWMATLFFKDGLMPSFDVFDYFDERFGVEEKHAVNGLHYHRTCEAWHGNHVANQREILDVFSASYGPKNALKHWNYWRIFFLACSELFRWNQGREWFVGHFLMDRK